MRSASTDTLDGFTPEQRLRARGIELPPAAPAVGDYAPTAIAGSLLMTSCQLPWIAGDLKFKGKISADLTPEQGYQAFRLSALNAIAQIKAALGSLDRVKKVVRLEGTNVEAGRKLLEESGRKIITASGLTDAAKKIVAAVKGAA